jgi:hypothetical protein
MAMSIHDIIFHSQNKKYPDIVTTPGLIQNLTAATTDDGVEIFKFIRPNVTGDINPSTGELWGEESALLKSELEGYSKKTFNLPLPKAISSHEFTEGGLQLEAPRSGQDPRYNSLRPTNLQENHGWKVHADFVADLTEADAFARTGRATDLSIIDQSVADNFDARLANLGLESDSFFKYYKKNSSILLNNQKNLPGGRWFFYRSE